MPVKAPSVMKGSRSPVRSPLGSPTSRTTKTLFVLFVVFAMIIFLAGATMLIFAWKGRKEMDTTSAKLPETKVIVVSSDSAAQPPVYPLKSPDYPTRRTPQDFQQVGVLVDPSDSNGGTDPTILALFGRKMTTRDRWEYYVASDKFHMWKLPVQVQKRMCDHEFGCEEIFNGDQVVVPDYGNRVFTARIYAYSDPNTGSRL